MKKVKTERCSRPGLNSRGHEIPDPRPAAIPVHVTRRYNDTDHIRSIIRGVLSDRAKESGHETFEESEDFDIDDDPIVHTPWELPSDEEDLPPGWIPRQPGSGDPGPVAADFPAAALAKFQNGPKKASKASPGPLKAPPAAPAAPAPAPQAPPDAQ